MAVASNTQGVSFAIRGNYEEALNYYNKSLLLYEELGYKKGIHKFNTSVSSFETGIYFVVIRIDNTDIISQNNHKTMKIIITKVLLPFYILSMTFILLGCKKFDIDKELRIDIGTHFNNENVSIKLDDDEIFTGIVSTNQVLGVGEVLTFNYPIGRYEMTVNVNGIETKEKFRHKKGRFVYIKFDKATSKITISYPDEKFIYD